jgi:hypothetical protein
MGGYTPYFTVLHYLHTGAAVWIIWIQARFVWIKGTRFARFYAVMLSGSSWITNLFPDGPLAKWTIIYSLPKRLFSALEKGCFLGLWQSIPAWRSAFNSSNEDRPMGPLFKSNQMKQWIVSSSPRHIKLLCLLSKGLSVHTATIPCFLGDPMYVFKH